ncbi:MAG: hypothetical protein ACXVZX_14510 [Terriglobales bacterium]
MKPLFLAGLVVLILGIASFFVALPHSENHGVKIGDASVGVTTHSSQKLPPAVGAVLVVGGIVMMVAGGKSQR